jgi:hypothetical protein
MSPLRPAQERCLDRWMRQPFLGAALDRGLGKTRVAQHGMQLFFEINKFLVVAPGRVARLVWRQEAAKFGHLDPGRMRVLGPEDFDMWCPRERPEKAPKNWRAGELVFRDVKATRRHLRSLIAENDVVVVPVNWLWTLSEALVTGPESSPFDGFIFDESGYARHRESLVWRGARRFAVQAQGARLMMNGTPRVRSWEEVWSQSYLIDEGETFGRGLGEFRNAFLRPTSYGPGGHVAEWGDPTAAQLEGLNAGFGALWIAEQRTDSMGTEIEIPCELSAEHWSIASKFLRGAVADCAGHTVLPINAGVGWSKSIQACNGRVYDEHKEVIELHQEKLDALEEIVETTERGILVMCWLDSDHAAVLKRLGKKAISIKVKGGLESWMAGKPQVLVAHPRAASHGLNLQAVGHTLVWLGLHPDLELYLQAGARFPREGQTHPVVIYRLMTNHPAETAVWKTLQGRGSALDNLMQAGREI